MTQPFLRVTEIFHSIQGESTWIGSPCVFVRLTGCPLRCVWCDTAYAFEGGTRMTLDEIMETVTGFDCPVVELTGGEPLAHKGAFELAQRIVDADFTLLVETSGAFPISGLPEQAHVIMDLKCPDSGENERNLWTNLGELGSRDEIKFVIASRRDYEWARDTITEHGLDQRVRAGTLRALLMSPVVPVDEATPQTLRDPDARISEGDPALKQLADWMLEDRLPARLQTQLHKHVWGATATGV